MWYIVTSEYIPKQLKREDKVLLIIKSELEAEKFKDNDEYYKLFAYNERKFELTAYIVKCIFTFDCLDIACVQISPDIHLLCSLMAAFNYTNKTIEKLNTTKVEFHVHEVFFGNEYLTPYWSQLLSCDIDPIGVLIAGDKMITKNKKLNSVFSYFGEKYPLQVDVLKTFFTWKSNPSIHYTLRTYDNIIEYNPHFIKKLSDEDIYDDLLLLSTRILFGHPYRDIPDGIDHYHAAELSDWKIIQKLNLPVDFEDRDFYENLGHFDDYIWQLYRSVFMTEPIQSCSIKQAIKNRIDKKLTPIAYEDQAQFWHLNPEQYAKILNFIKERSTPDAIMQRNCKEVVRESFCANPTDVGPFRRLYC